MTRIHFLLLLDRLEEIITKSPRLAGRSFIVCDDALELLDKIRMALPQEVRKADEIINEREDYLRRAKQEGEEILRRARLEASKLLAEHIIIKQADAEAAAVKEKAMEFSEQAKIELSQYTQRILSRLEENLVQALKAIHKAMDEFSEADED